MCVCVCVCEIESEKKGGGRVQYRTLEDVGLGERGEKCDGKR